jgi:hypothetical protein
MNIQWQVKGKRPRLATQDNLIARFTARSVFRNIVDKLVLPLNDAVHVIGQCCSERLIVVTGFCLER